MTEDENIQVFKKYSMLAGPAALGLLTLISPLISEMSYSMQAIPFVASLILLGLPHGAMDHLVPSKLSNMSEKKGIIAVSLLYLVIGGIYTVSWLFLPLLSAGFFILLTWIHWGQGDLYAMRKFHSGEEYREKFPAFISATIRGGIPMFVPLAFHPDLYISFMKSMEALFASNTASYSILYSWQIKAAIISAIAILSASMSIYMYVKNDRLPIYGLSEIIVLVAFFVALPPIFAVGIYFCLWHSLRHLTRLSLLPGDSRQAITAKNLGRYIWDMTKNTLPLTLISILMLAIAALFMDTASQSSLLALYLVFISVLTLPHTVVVSWMDSIQYRS
jgi:Brp/Blh family beta-carotene 15,15'-monooxygenase